MNFRHPHLTWWFHSRDTINQLHFVKVTRSTIDKELIWREISLTIIGRYLWACSLQISRSQSRACLLQREAPR